MDGRYGAHYGLCHPLHQIINFLGVGKGQFNEFFCIILLLATTQDILYPYGPGHRDLETPKMDDGSSPEITLLIPFIFFNIPYRSIYVSLDQDPHCYCIETSAHKIISNSYTDGKCEKVLYGKFLLPKIKGFIWPEPSLEIP